MVGLGCSPPAETGWSGGQPGQQRRRPGERHGVQAEAIAVIRGVAEGDLGRAAALEVEADVVLVGHADAAVQLHGLARDQA